MTFGEARAKLSSFLESTGCYEICKSCPVYPGGEGCCKGCANLLRDKEGTVTGCGNQNLSCLSYTCGVLNEHLRRQEDSQFGNKLNQLTRMIYSLPREGYRGCEKRGDQELLTIQDPLAVVVRIRRENRIFSPCGEKTRALRAGIPSTLAEGES